MKEVKIKDIIVQNQKVQTKNNPKETNQLFTYPAKATQWRLVKIEKANNG